MALNGVDSSVEPTATLYCTFVYLDSSERKRFSQQVRYFTRSSVIICAHTDHEPHRSHINFSTYAFCRVTSI